MNVAVANARHALKAGDISFGSLTRGLRLRLRCFSVSAHRAHRFAALRTGAAVAYAIVHVANLFAAISAGRANVGTRCAHHRVDRGLAEHEIGRCLADFRAVDHEAVMVGFNMFAALL